MITEEVGTNNLVTAAAFQSQQVAVEILKTYRLMQWTAMGPRMPLRGGGERGERNFPIYLVMPSIVLVTISPNICPQRSISCSRAQS